MDARPCQILEFFDGTKQMLVPLFQRPYQWDVKEWEALWSDLLEQYESAETAVSTHFTGAIVTAPARSIPIGVSKHLVIDGQQRLTTITVLLCAMRSFHEADSKEYRKITRLLINEDDEDLDYYKLLPTQPDRDAFKKLIAGQPEPGSRFAQALEFFRKKIAGKDSDDEPIDLERLHTTVRNRLTVVSIHLGDTDDPYLIFESLNAKGAPLTQSDLIRNYLLLRLHSGVQQKAYEEAWLPMQGLLGPHLTEFMRHYLMMSGEEVAKSSIYAVLKKRLLEVSDTSVAEELQRMQRTSLLYAQIVGLSDAPGPLKQGLARLRRWEIATANPLLLKLLDAHEQGRISTQDVARCLAVVESFAVRREICSVATNQLKRIFLSLTKDMPDSDMAGWLSKTLASGASGRRWPKDQELGEALLRYRAYGNSSDRCKFILEAVEEQHRHKEPAAFEKATIEHIMPRTLTSEWLGMLGPEAKALHDKWIDLLGNLTLTAYNGELSNFSFARKREIFHDSHFELNKWIAAREQWAEADLRARTTHLWEQLKQIWPRPE